MSKGIYRFAAGSPAEKLGIKPIDLRKVGTSLAPASSHSAPSSSAAESSAAGNVTFEFTDGSAMDGKKGIVGAAMVVDGIALTTRQIIGSDKTDQGNTTTIFKTANSLTINTGSVSGLEYRDLDPGEAWVFDFDTDVVLNTIDLVGLDRGETMVITILDASNGSDGVAHKVSGKDQFKYGQALTAGTAVRIEQTVGVAKIGAISVTKSSR